MNELLDDNALDDDPIIARVRSALDELTATSADGEMVAHPPRTMTSARWLAVAAAAVLVVGATAAVYVNRGNQGEPASTPPASAAPVTIPSEPPLIRVEVPFFTIASPDLVAGERTFEQCCLADPQLVMAWTNGLAYLTLTEFPAGPLTDVFPDADSTVREMESATLLFRSFGLTAELRDELAALVVAGSGLPYVLQVDGFQGAALGFTSGEQRLEQVYTPLNTDPLSSYLPTVTLSVGEYRGEFDLLAPSSDPQRVNVAGYGGWKVTDADGTVTVFWDVGRANWATLRIDAQLADRADGLIAAISEIDPIQPVVEVEGASDSAAVGRLVIPSLGLDWVVVDPGSDVEEAKKAGPVLLEGLPPGDAGLVTVIWGHRTTYGAPFGRLDELSPGDEITWTTEFGTATLEVIAVRVTDDPTGGVASDGTTLQLVTSHPEYSSAQVLVVDARPVD